MITDCPDFQTQRYKVEPYLNVAVQLQEMGEDRAVQLLRDAAKERESDSKVIVLCRMLFQRKEDGEFRRPLIGGPTFPGGTDYADWPLEPIEIIDGIPFLIVKGYSIAGSPETASSYLEYCLANCSWTAISYRVKSESEKVSAAGTLIASPKWKTPLTSEEMDWLRSQI